MCRNLHIITTAVNFITLLNTVHTALMLVVLSSVVWAYMLAML